MPSGEIFLTLGAVLLVSLLADWGAGALKLPRISLLLLIGIVIGPSALDLLPLDMAGWSESLTGFALLLVAFLLGGELRLDQMRRDGGALVAYSLAIVCVTSMTVALGLWMIGAPPVLALLLGGIAAATDPAAVSAVARETGRHNRRTRLLLGIVAIDDAWGLIVFGAMLALAGWLVGSGGASLAGIALRELVGGLLVWPRVCRRPI